MDFSFTEEQTLLRNSVQSLLADKYDFDTRRKIVKSAEGWSPAIWKQFAELGLLAAPFSEELGGLGGGSIETMILMEEFGRHLVVEPFVETVVLAGGFLRQGGSKAQQDAHIPGIIDGSTVWTFAYAEPQGRYNLADLVTTAKKDGAGYTINGYKAVVLGAPWAQKLIVTARTSGCACPECWKVRCVSAVYSLERKKRSNSPYRRYTNKIMDTRALPMVRY